MNWKSPRFIVFAVLILAGVASLPFTVFAEAKSDAAVKSANPVVAEVNGTKIYKNEVMDVVQTLPLQSPDQAEQVYPVVIDQIINTKLIEEKAKAANLQSDPEVVKQLAEIKEQLVRKIYVEREINKLITEDRLKQEYEKIQADNKDKMETRARHILVDSKEKAESMIKELEKGAKFDELAQKNSIGPTASRGGDLGYFTQDAMVPEFSEVAFKTAPGTFAKTPIQTQFGWHVIFVEDRRKREVPGFEELKPSIRNALAQQSLDQLLEGMRKTAEIKRYNMDGKPLN